MSAVGDDDAGKPSKNLDLGGGGPVPFENKNKYKDMRGVGFGQYVSKNVSQKTENLKSLVIGNSTNGAFTGTRNAMVGTKNAHFGAEPTTHKDRRLQVFSNYIQTIKQRQDIMRKNMSYLDGLKKRIGGLEVEKAKRYQDVTIEEGDQHFLDKST